MKSLTIIPRCDTEEKWEEINPIPKEREICIVYTQWCGTKYKLGDGKTHYSHLPFTTLENVLENGIMYASPTNVVFKGFIKEIEETNEQVYCPGEFVW